MPYIIAGLCLLFLCPSLFFVYRCGLRDGLSINNGAKTIDPIRTPIEYIEQRREVKETKKQEDLLAQGLTNLFGFDGTPQKGSEKD